MRGMMANNNQQHQNPSHEVSRQHVFGEFSHPSFEDMKPTQSPDVVSHEENYPYSPRALRHLVEGGGLTQQEWVEHAERGQKIAGHRGYFLKGYGVLLNQALINFGLKFLMKEGYELTQPPFFMKKEIMHETCQLSDF